MINVSKYSLKIGPADRYISSCVLFGCPYSCAMRSRGIVQATVLDERQHQNEKRVFFPFFFSFSCVGYCLVREYVRSISGVLSVYGEDRKEALFFRFSHGLRNIQASANNSFAGWKALLLTKTWSDFQQDGQRMLWHLPVAFNSIHHHHQYHSSHLERLTIVCKEMAFPDSNADLAAHWDLHELSGSNRWYFCLPTVVFVVQSLDPTCDIRCFVASFVHSFLAHVVLHSAATGLCVECSSGKIRHSLIQPYLLRRLMCPFHCQVERIELSIDCYDEWYRIHRVSYMKPILLSVVKNVNTW